MENTITLPTGTYLFNTYPAPRMDARVIFDEDVYTRDKILKLCMDEGFQKAFLKADPDVYNDRDFILEAINRCPSYRVEILNSLPEGLKNDKAIVTAALNKNGLELEYASDEMKDDIDTVAVAVKNNKDAIYMASLRIRNNKMLLKNRKEIKEMKEYVEKEIESQVEEKKSFFKR
jgi:hypothetical protein